jgi:hypothetical protein
MNGNESIDYISIERDFNFRFVLSKAIIHPPIHSFIHSFKFIILIVYKKFRVNIIISNNIYIIHVYSVIFILFILLLILS